ncbi:hypothetical protein CI109_103936 [Kwoniella shandongensis]|uniref:Peroxin-14 n=1 Tax=Kwoniella shandongensis TaxID=1734106 RepID=A0A5M6BT42_9TREE|nr:uncharacterized protein CI109_005610 [Kwoniella shandongensis]KAA5526014.1 hypothetical protein CI109_005610 [Kwoniella shandongensis]
MSDPTSPPSGSSNPLFGATPPPTTITDDPTPPSQPSPVEPEAATLTGVRDGTTNPLFGASPPDDRAVEEQVYSKERLQVPYSAPRRQGAGGIIPRSSLSAPTRSIPTFIRRLTFVLSLLLGLSSSIALVWSYFLLPLLHASFSARKVIVTQQVDRMTNIVDNLRRLRTGGLFPPNPTAIAGEKDVAVGAMEGNPTAGEQEEKTALLIEKEATLREIDSSTTSSEHGNDHGDPPSTPTQTAEHLPISPIPSLQSLTRSLRSLTTALDSTSTTRTSLISTLESYTSHLHRQLFVARPTGSGGFGIGMGTLSANLSKESGRAGAGFDTLENQSRGEEWDAVRKEVRAIKGMLLNRRSFAPTTTTNGITA